MMNLASASTLPAAVTSDKEGGGLSTTSGVSPADASIWQARGRAPSEHDVSRFQQALTQGRSESEDPVSASLMVHPSLGLTTLEPGPVASRPLTDAEKAPQAVTNPVHAESNPEAMTSPLPARMRWIERRKIWESDTANEDKQPSPDAGIATLQASGHKGVQALVQSVDTSTPAVNAPVVRAEPVAENSLPLPMTKTVDTSTPAVNAPVVRVEPVAENSLVQPLVPSEVNTPAATHFAPLQSTDPYLNKVRAQIHLGGSADLLADGRPVDTSAGPVPAVPPLAPSDMNTPARIEETASTLDTAWASRTVQETVRTTLRTLALRDLESLDAGRPVQITLDQGQLRGAQLTLQANNGLLEVSVSAPLAELRATLDAAHDALEQGLLRDVGAVRWIGLQETWPTLSMQGDSSASSATSQQNSQGDGSKRQNQGQEALTEPDELRLTETEKDKGQVVANAQSLRAFLGL